MRLVSLNVWGATQGQILLDYLQNLSKTTDIFCLQEVFSAQQPAPKISSGARMYLFEELSLMLPDFVGFFEPRSTGYDFFNKIDQPVSHGLAIFIKKNLPVVTYSSHIIDDNPSVDDPVEGLTMAQVVRLKILKKSLSLINFHGVAQPGDKLDTPQRIRHTQKLKLIWDSLDSVNILCGDFNLYPETETVKILEEAGRNLIKEFNIQNTRNELSWKKYPGSRQTFADFTFVSESLKVKNFEVPYNEVSDHLPMILEFDL